MSRKQIFFTLNGARATVSGKYVFQQLSDYLRYKRNLTGTKVVCAEGDCGACTILFNRPSVDKVFRSLNSCVAKLGTLDGCHLITSDYLGSPKALHEVQRAVVDKFGTQCGFCTPGFIMSLTNMFEHKKNVTKQNIKNYLTGNLCRCTGYHSIIEAALEVDTKNLSSVTELIDYTELSNWLHKNCQDPLLIEREGKVFYAPNSVELAASYLGAVKGVTIVSGASDLGVQINKGKRVWNKVMSLHLIESLYSFVKHENGDIEIGSRVTLDRLQHEFESIDGSFSEFLNIFASPQIKNIATLVGNLVNGSPIADTTPYMMARGAQLILKSVRGKRVVPLIEFYKGYKHFDLNDDELVESVVIPNFDSKETPSFNYKVSQRRDLDISCINACILIQKNGNLIEKASVVYGGVGPTTLNLKEVESKMEGSTLGEELFQEVEQTLDQTLTPLSDVRGTAEYRKGLSRDVMRKFFSENGVRV